MLYPGSYLRPTGKAFASTDKPRMANGLRNTGMNLPSTFPTSGPLCYCLDTSFLHLPHHAPPFGAVVWFLPVPPQPAEGRDAKTAPPPATDRRRSSRTDKRKLCIFFIDPPRKNVQKQKHYIGLLSFQWPPPRYTSLSGR